MQSGKRYKQKNIKEIFFFLNRDQASIKPCDILFWVLFAPPLVPLRVYVQVILNLHVFPAQVYTCIHICRLNMWTKQPLGYIFVPQKCKFTYWFVNDITEILWLLFKETDEKREIITKKIYCNKNKCINRTWLIPQGGRYTFSKEKFPEYNKSTYKQKINMKIFRCAQY